MSDDSVSVWLDRLSTQNIVLRDIALWKLEGFTNAEIAARAGRSVAPIERKLALIRALWAQEAVA